MNSRDGNGLSYRDSGVDIDAGNELVERIKPLAKKTTRPGVMEGLGGFGAMFEIPTGKFRNPVLVSGTDGVGTKLKLADMMGRHDTIGIDLVAMCVNDIVTSGAEPLFFLDYFATSGLDVDQAESVVKGIADGCMQAGCALIGGETAEMPGLYRPGEYDLAGFAVGAVEKDDIMNPANVQDGDVLLGLGSSGFHSNGYSLVRKVLEVSKSGLDDEVGGAPLGEALLAPTRIYVKPLLECFSRATVTAASHITGGGITENLPRVLPPGLAARIDTSLWDWPPVFKWIQHKGKVSDSEMYRTFNCGIGMILCVRAEDADVAVSCLANSGEAVTRIGNVVKSDTPGVVLEGRNE